jgi:hypothetical protein
MGAIKDIVDLCIQLRNEDRDGRIAAAIGQIQPLIFSLQSEQVGIVEKNSELVKENLALHRKIMNMETVHAHAIKELEEKHRAEIAKIEAHNADVAEALEPKTFEILKYFFEAGGDLTDIMIARRFQLQLSMAEYHTDTLITKKFIVQTTVGHGPGSAAFGLTGMGREYVVRKCFTT